jgi:hypothetical protein
MQAFRAHWPEYLMEAAAPGAFKIKGGSHEKREIEVPAYITDIARVQVYCAWAEVLLGEAEFAAPVR